MKVNPRRTDLLRTIRLRERSQAAAHLRELRDREDDLVRRLHEVRVSARLVGQSLRATESGVSGLAVEVESNALHAERTRAKLVELASSEASLGDELRAARELISRAATRVVEADTALKILDEA